MRGGDREREHDRHAERPARVEPRLGGPLERIEVARDGEATDDDGQRRRPHRDVDRRGGDRVAGRRGDATVERGLERDGRAGRRAEGDQARGEVADRPPDLGHDHGDDRQPDGLQPRRGDGTVAAGSDPEGVDEQAEHDLPGEERHREHRDADRLDRHGAATTTIAPPKPAVSVHQGTDQSRRLRSRWRVVRSQRERHHDEGQRHEEVDERRDHRAAEAIAELSVDLRLHGAEHPGHQRDRDSATAVARSLTTGPRRGGSADALVGVGDEPRHHVGPLADHVALAAADGELGDERHRGRLLVAGEGVEPVEVGHRRSRLGLVEREQLDVAGHAGVHPGRAAG